MPDNVTFNRWTFKAGIMADLILADTVSRLEMNMADQSFLEILLRFDIGYATYKSPVSAGVILNSREFESPAVYLKNWRHILAVFKD